MTRKGQVRVMTLTFGTRLDATDYSIRICFKLRETAKIYNNPFNLTRHIISQGIRGPSRCPPPDHRTAAAGQDAHGGSGGTESSRLTHPDAQTLAAPAADHQ